MQALAGLCLALFIVTISVVGVRMLLLARRTHGRHELLMGAGMVLVGALGYPGSLASGFGRSIAELNLPLFVAASLVTQLGIALVYAFTWQVFRPDERWGQGLVAAGAAFMLIGLGVTTHAIANAPPDAGSQLVARNGLFVSMVGYCGCFLWAAIEGFAKYGMARKRLALGLADPIIANRFWLWGVFGLAAASINVTSAVGTALGVDPSQSPLMLIPMGVLGFVASAAMYLAFMPPASYLAFVRGRMAEQRS